MSRTLTACWALFKIRVATQLQYRAAAIANSSIGIFWGVLQITMITVFYTYGNPDGAALSLRQAVSYMWLVQILHGLVVMYNVDNELREMITGGNVSVELCRPLNLYDHWYAKTSANRIGGAFWRMVIISAVAITVPGMYGLGAPVSFVSFVLFTVSLTTAFFLSVSFAMVVTAVRLGLTWGDGPIWMITILSGVLGGAYLPLQLWPDAMQPFLRLQPFAGFMDTPFRLYIGSLPVNDAAFSIGLQLIWIIIFLILGKWLMNRKLQHLIVQGG
jgi:ABC-2 type transport system permease protein